MILTVIWPSDTSGRRKGGLTSTVCSALGRPRYLVNARQRAGKVRARSWGWFSLPGHRRENARHAAPRLPGGWGAAQDPADVLTATVGEGVDATPELARHLQDEEHHAGTGSGRGRSPVQPLPRRRRPRSGCSGFAQPCRECSQGRALLVSGPCSRWEGGVGLPSWGKVSPC